MSNSSMVSYIKISPNKTSPRNHAIDTITIHCVVGQLSAESICGCFTSLSRNASCNYAVGKDGKIGLCVDERDRSWCSSNRANDHRAITIEVASDKTEPFAVTDEAYNALIELVADICRRNGIKQLLWKGDMSLIGQVDKQNMTVHRWFANKSCPGSYLYNRHGDIAMKVNALLGLGESPAPVVEESSKFPYSVKVITEKLYIRTGAGTNYNKNGSIRDKGVYTIMAESTGNGAKLWGKLKSGAGWIALDFTEKV